MFLLVFITFQFDVWGFLLKLSNSIKKKLILFAEDLTSRLKSK